MTTTNDRNESCEDRIGAHMADRDGDLRSLLAAAEGIRADTVAEPEDGTILREDPDDDEDPAVVAKCSACGLEIRADDREDPYWVHVDDDEEACRALVGGEHISSDDAYERINEYALGAEVRYTLRIDLSTGGPADYLTADLSRERFGWDVVGVQYHFADWFDHAERPVREGSALWRYVESVAEVMPVPDG